MSEPDVTAMAEEVLDRMRDQASAKRRFNKKRAERQKSAQQASAKANWMSEEECAEFRRKLREGINPGNRT